MNVISMKVSYHKIVFLLGEPNGLIEFRNTL